MVRYFQRIQDVAVDTMFNHRSILLLLFTTLLPFGSQAQTKDMRDLLRGMEGPAYGRHCGIVGDDPAPRIQLEALLQFRDSLGVVGMLFDKDKVFQVYGAEGLIRLQRSGMRFPELIIQRVEELRRSKEEIKVCSGCSHWMMSIHEALADSMSVNNLR